MKGNKVMKRILDVCCGSKMFYFNKNNPLVHFNDLRKLEEPLCDGRMLKIHPNTQWDFRHLPVPDNTYDMVVFDPPHLVKVGDNSWLAKKYGKLPPEWKPYLKQGFDECMRVLKPYGTLVFKWNETDIEFQWEMPDRECQNFMTDVYEENRFYRREVQQ